MADKRPPDGEYTRERDWKNKKLPPSQRAINWAKAAATGVPAIIALLAALGYTNKDHIKDWTGLAEPDGKTEITESESTPFQQQVKKFSEEVRAELEELKGNTVAIRDQLAGEDRRNYQALLKQLNEIDKRLIDIEEVVQP